MSAVYRKRLSVALVTTILTTSLWAQGASAQVDSTAPPADLDAYVAAAMKTFNVPGLIAEAGGKEVR